MRLDALLLEKKLAGSREKARGYILAGQVIVDGRRIDKPGTAVSTEAGIEVLGGREKYVSRGGYKLEAAIEAFELDLQGLSIMDVGASTGGFTDCALQNGAEQVWAVDVGYGQLDWKIRIDPRVTVMEKTNIRLLEPEKIPMRFDLITVDVSFISLKLVFPVIKKLLAPNGSIICLIKPQFEAGRDKVGKKGVVRDPSTHLEVLVQVRGYARQNDLTIRKAAYSPLKGPEGNIEFLAYAVYQVPEADLDDRELEALVNQAHQALEAK